MNDDTTDQRERAKYRDGSQNKAAVPTIDTTGYVEDLARLAEHAPADFVAVRRRLLNGILQPDGVAKAHLLELQREVDAALAIEATPLSGLRQLHQRLDEHLAALAALTRRLEIAVDPPISEQG